MKKFIFLSHKGDAVIYECEVEQVIPTPFECKNEKNGKYYEQLYIVRAPKKFIGEKWYSQFLHDSLISAEQYAQNMIKIDLELLARKGKILSTDEITERLKIKVEML